MTLSKREKWSKMVPKLPYSATSILTSYRFLLVNWTHFNIVSYPRAQCWLGRRSGRDRDGPGIVRASQAERPGSLQPRGPRRYPQIGVKGKALG